MSLTMAEANHIAKIPNYKGSDASIAKEYNVDEETIHLIRMTKSYQGVNLK